MKSMIFSIVGIVISMISIIMSYMSLTGVMNNPFSIVLAVIGFSFALIGLVKTTRERNNV